MSLVKILVVSSVLFIGNLVFANLPEGHYKLINEEVTCQNGTKNDFYKHHDSIVIYLTVEHTVPEEGEEEAEASEEEKEEVIGGTIYMESRSKRRMSHDCYITSSGDYTYLEDVNADGEEKIESELKLDQTEKVLKKVCTGPLSGFARKYGKRFAEMGLGETVVERFFDKDGELEGFYMTRLDEDGFTNKCKKSGDDNPPTMKYIKVEAKEVEDIRRK